MNDSRVRADLRIDSSTNLTMRMPILARGDMDMEVGVRGVGISGERADVAAARRPVMDIKAAASVVRRAVGNEAFRETNAGAAGVRQIEYP